jgi:protein gp37
MGDTKISWADKVWNVVRGCNKVSSGCAHCYAERMAARFSGKGQPYEGLTHEGRWTGEARFVPDMLDAPRHWGKSSRIFVNSMGDLFHDDITPKQIAAVFGVMAACPQHSFLILTKRPARMRDWFAWLSMEFRNDDNPWVSQLVWRRAHELTPGGLPSPARHGVLWPLSNVWLGVSVEDQQTADERIPLLLQTPAAVRWVSAEPLLGPVDVFAFLKSDIRDRSLAALKSPPMPGLDWVVVGSESGPGERPMDEVWVQHLRNQCVDAKVAFYYKQKLHFGRKVSLPLLDGKRWAEVP